MIEWKERSEAVALRRSAAANAGAGDALQEAHEELRCTLELAETEIELRREQ